MHLRAARPGRMNGAKVVLKSSDQVGHNVNSKLQNNAVQHRSSPGASTPSTASRSRPTDSPGQVICDIHPWMTRLLAGLRQPVFRRDRREGELRDQERPGRHPEGRRLAGGRRLRHPARRARPSTIKAGGDVDEGLHDRPRQGQARGLIARVSRQLSVSSPGVGARGRVQPAIPAPRKIGVLHTPYAARSLTTDNSTDRPPATRPGRFTECPAPATIEAHDRSLAAPDCRLTRSLPGSTPDDVGTFADLPRGLLGASALAALVLLAGRRLARPTITARSRADSSGAATARRTPKSSSRRMTRPTRTRSLRARMAP